MDTTYKYLINGYFPKINISYQGTPGTTYKYLIQMRDKWKDFMPGLLCDLVFVPKV